MSQRFGLFSASFVHGGGTLSLTQLREQGINTNSRYGTIRPGGALNPAAHILSTANPTARFSTSDLATVFGNGSNAVTIASGLACSGGHVGRYQKRLAGGAFATSTSHYTQATPKGFLHVTGLDIDIDSQDGVNADLEYIALSSTGENPVTEDDDVDFTAAPAPAFGSQFYMGGCWHNSVQATGLIRARINPGIRFNARRSDGGVFPRFDMSSIVARDPSIDLTFLKADMRFSLGSFFCTELAGTLSVYMQRGTAAADGRISTASASHHRIDAATGSWGTDAVQVVGEDDATLTVRAMATGLLAITTGVVIP